MSAAPNVIIAAFETALVEMIQRVFERDYDIVADTAKSWEELNRKGRELHAKGSNIALVVLDEKLGDPLVRPLREQVDELLLGMLRVCWVHGVIAILDKEPSLSGQRGNCACVRRTGLSEDEFRGVLDRFLQRPSPGPKIELPVPQDPLLEEQIRSLDPHLDLDVAKRLFGWMMRRFWSGCETVVVKSIPQGFSGSKVIAIKRTLTGTSRSVDDFVVKIIPKNKVWRIRHGLGHWNRIREALAPKEYDVSIPSLVLPDEPDIEGSASGLLVSAGTSYAMAFGFLGTSQEEFIGSPEDEFISFEQAYKLSGSLPPNLKDHFCELEESLAKAVLRHLFVRLRAVWYEWDAKTKDDHLKTEERTPKIEERTLWDATPSLHRPEKPPRAYQLGINHRIGILEYIDRLDQLGARLFGDKEWQPAADVVRSWLRLGPSPTSPLVRSRNVMVSAVHGDLNRHNVLLYVREGRVFLIDFDTYQPDGLTMQDFAHLEAQVIYSLMDCEIDGDSIPALDISWGQLQHWKVAQDHLLCSDWKRKFTRRGKTLSNIVRAVGLVQYIRGQAHDVRQHLSGTHTDFEIEYGAALLYHTLRSIAHRRISPFKRILAIYSTARLIAHIDNLGESDKAASDL